MKYQIIIRNIICYSNNSLRKIITIQKVAKEKLLVVQKSTLVI